MASDYFEIISCYASLRVLVGFLGEKSQYNWWDTDFLSKTGAQFLAINFPRSAFAAGCTSASEAAKRLHDRLIGKGGVYHLFRFPQSIEQTLHSHLLTFNQEELSASLETTDSALKKLGSFFSSHIDAPDGPVQIGIANKILTDSAIEEVAKHYHDAFLRGKKTFPYFAQSSR